MKLCFNETMVIKNLCTKERSYLTSSREKLEGFQFIKGAFVAKSNWALYF